jgi:hypothetical protein
MKKLILISLTISFVILTSCNNVKLSNSEAESLVKTSLNLPMLCEAVFSGGIYGGDYQQLINQAILSGNDYMNLEINEGDKEYFTRKINTGYGRVQYRFKAYDIDLDNITGLSVDKNTSTAIIRFTLKVTNPTFFMNNGGYFRIENFENDISENINIDSKFNGELRFRKFDTGWQLESSPSQGYSTILESFIRQRN